MIRSINQLEDDICLIKRIIENVLYRDPDIVELIDNPEIDKDAPEDLVWTNIFPFIRIPGTQDASKNFICYEVDDMGEISRNDIIKQQYIQFVVFVHKDLIKTKYGIPRHDAIGYILRDLFNRSRMFGHTVKLVQSRGGTTDTDYYTRTLRFQLMTPEQTQDGLFENRYERLINKDGEFKYERITVG